MQKGGFSGFLIDWLFYTLVVSSLLSGVFAFKQGQYVCSVAALGAAAMFYSVGQAKNKKRERWAIVAAFVLLVSGLLCIALTSE